MHVAITIAILISSGARVWIRNLVSAFTLLTCAHRGMHRLSVAIRICMHMYTSTCACNLKICISIDIMINGNIYFTYIQLQNPQQRNWTSISIRARVRTRDPRVHIAQVLELVAIVLNMKVNPRQAEPVPMSWP